MDDYKIHQGDARELAKTLPDQSIQTIITSPPYFGLRDYQTASWEGGEAECDHVAMQTGMSDKNTLGPNGYLPPGNAANVGRVRQYRDVCGKCGAKRVDSQFGMEATPEEFVDKLVALFRELRRALRDDGTLWLNLGDSYNGSGGAGGDYAAGGLKEGQPKYPGRSVTGLKPKDLCGIPWRCAFALQADGWYLRSDIIWHKPNPMPSSVRDRPTSSHEYIFLLSKRATYYYDNEAIKERAVGEPHSPGNKTVRKPKNKDRDDPGHDPDRVWAEDGMRNKRSVWTVNTRPYRGAHFATFNPALIEPCVLAGCPPGGVVLDPFMGSGTTAVVALALGRHAIGFELNPEYIALADARIAASRIVKKAAPPKLESQLDGLPLFTKLLKGERHAR